MAEARLKKHKLLPKVEIKTVGAGPRANDLRYSIMPAIADESPRYQILLFHFFCTIFQIFYQFKSLLPDVFNINL